MIEDIVKRAKESCEACMHEFGFHKYMPSNAYGAESFEAEFAGRDKMLIHFDFEQGITPCQAETILDEIITGMDDKQNPIFLDGFDEEFYGEEEEEEGEGPEGDEDLPL